MLTHRYIVGVTLTLPDGYDPPHWIDATFYTDISESKRFTLIEPVSEPEGVGAVVLANNVYYAYDRVMFVRTASGGWVDPVGDSVYWYNLTNVEVLSPGYIPY